MSDKFFKRLRSTWSSMLRARRGVKPCWKLLLVIGFIVGRADTGRAADVSSADMRPWTRTITMQNILPSVVAKALTEVGLPEGVIQVVPNDAAKALYVDGNLHGVEYIRWIFGSLDKLSWPHNGSGSATDNSLKKKPPAGNALSKRPGVAQRHLAQHQLLVLERMPVENLSNHHMALRLKMALIPAGIIAFVPDIKPGFLWIYGTPLALEELRTMIKQLDLPGARLWMQNILPSSLAKTLTEAGLPEGVTKVVPYDAEKFLYVEASQQGFLRLRDVMHDLDKPLLRSVPPSVARSIATTSGERIHLRHIPPSDIATALTEARPSEGATKVVSFDAEKALHEGDDHAFRDLTSILQAFDESFGRRSAPAVAARSGTVGGVSEGGMPEGGLQTALGQARAEPLVIEPIPIYNEHPLALASELNSRSLTGIKAVAADRAAKLLWVYGTKQGIENVKPIIRSLDLSFVEKYPRPGLVWNDICGESPTLVTTQVSAIRLKNALPSALQRRLVLPDGVAQIIALDQHNILLAKGTQSGIQTLKRTVKELDR